MIVGLTSGTFDLFHHSHLLYLERCKAQCDKLIVGVDADELVRKIKGEFRPIHGARHRLNLINSLSIVDSAFILHKVEDLMSLAANFAVDKVFKCEKFAGPHLDAAISKDTSAQIEQHIFGTEFAELVIIPDIPGMINTTKIVEMIKAGKTRSGPIPSRSME
jgi:cytidyltransferase-like protein